MSNPAVTIWNRAAEAKGGTSPRIGDEALSDLLYAHGMVMNGGVEHVFDVLSETEFEDAIAGFTCFGRSDVAALMIEARGARRRLQLDAMLTKALSLRYETLISDSALFAMFERRLAEHPENFAPAS